MKLTGAQIICRLLEQFGIETVSGIPGGSILPLYNELNKSKIKHILVRQEQAAGFIAQGMTRSSGKPAVCLATSGPGAMNLLTAIADARADSIPIIAITGQVNTSLIGTDAFQEADTFGLSFPISKHSIAVKTPQELLTAIPQSFKIAMEGRPGPVLIDVPRDVQCAECEVTEFPDISAFYPSKDEIRFATKPETLKVLVEEACKLFLDSKKCVMYLGGGCSNPESAELIRNFKKEFPLPVVSSLMGLGAIPKSDEDFCGMVGMHGSFAANKAMSESDLVFALGVRFDDRATGVVEKFCPNAKIIHIDIDAAEINKILPSSISMVGRIEKIMPEIIKTLINLKSSSDKKATTEARENWRKSIIDLKNENYSNKLGSPKDFDSTKLENPRSFIENVVPLAKKMNINENDIIVTTDVGQHQMFASQYYPINNVRSFLTSGSLGTMGFGLPAALGASISFPQKKVICFSGDGSILMNIQELATLKENNLDVTIVLFVNGTLGMVYQQQKYLFNENYSASIFDTAPDFLKIAKGFGIEGTCANTDKEWYNKAFNRPENNKPFIVTVYVDKEENVLPFVPGGKANIDAILN